MTTAYTKRVVLIVAAADRDAANAALRRLAGGDVFVAPLWLEGAAEKDPPTHYACCWQMTPAERLALGQAISRAGVAVAVRDLSHWDPAAARGEIEGEFAARKLRLAAREATAGTVSAPAGA